MPLTSIPGRHCVGFLHFLVFLAAMAATGCGGSRLKGSLLDAPPPDPATQEKIFEQVATLPLPEVDRTSWFITPAGVRLSPAGCAVVDLLVILDDSMVQKSHLESSIHAIWSAKYVTNGISIPGTDQDLRLVMQREDGSSPRVRRPLQPEPTTEQQRRDLGLVGGEASLVARYLPDRPSMITYRTYRKGTGIWACIVPILVYTEPPLTPGELVTVRLLPPDRFDFDGTPSCFQVKLTPDASPPGPSGAEAASSPSAPLVEPSSP